MIVVSNTSPINYLVLIGQQDFLEKLFGRVVIPQSVFEELQRENTPLEVRDWIKNFPAYLAVQKVSAIEDSALENLHVGERDAISLVEELKADLLLIDDKQGRELAESRSIIIMGTVGVLEQAAKQGLIDLRKTFYDLQQTSFRISSDILQSLLERYEKSGSKE